MTISKPRRAILVLIWIAIFFLVGVSYWKRNISTLEFFISEANLGNPDAAYMLCQLYFSGTYTDKDPVIAANWCQTAADLGHGEAAFYVGNWYMYAKQGRQYDPDQALKYYEVSAAQEVSGAQFSLGQIYRQPLYVSPDYDRAAKLLRAATQQGHAAAHFALGQMYLKGEGRPANSAIAEQFIAIAHEYGYVLPETYITSSSKQ